MADSAGLEGPTSGVIEAPTGLTSLELRAAESARRQIVQHLGRNPVLSMDDLAELKDPRPRLEKEFRLPGDSRQKNRIWFFSIDGTLRGNRLTHCLFAGECIMVQAPDFTKANAMANDGLRETIDLAYEYWKESQGALVYANPLEPTMVEAGGGRTAAAMPQQQDLAKDPKLRAMLAHVMGGKPWSW